MAKDPAFLFYPGDWQGGTSTYSRHLKGCYMDVLIAQFNSGPLSIEEIKTVLGTDFAAWGTLSKKFKKTSEGLFFNERLELEKNKRKAFSESQRNKRLGKTRTGETSPEKPVFNQGDNRNENKDEVKEVGGSGEETRDGVVMYSPAEFLKETSNSLWIENVSRVSGSTLEEAKAALTSFAGQQEVKSGYPRTLAKLKEHFFNWYKIDLEKKPKGGKIKTAVSSFEKQKQEILAKHGTINNNG